MDITNSQRKIGGGIFTGLIERVNFEDNTFDMVYMGHILEHCADPIVMLTEVKRIMKPNGILFIEVPNEENFRIRLWLINLMRRLLIRGKINSIKPYPEHLFFYTRKTITMILNKAGLAINCCKVEGYSSPYRFRTNIMDLDWKTYLFSLILRTGIDVKIGLGSYITIDATKYEKIY